MNKWKSGKRTCGRDGGCSGLKPRFVSFEQRPSSYKRRRVSVRLQLESTERLHNDKKSNATSRVVSIQFVFSIKTKYATRYMLHITTHYVHFWQEHTGDVFTKKKTAEIKIICDDQRRTVFRDHQSVIRHRHIWITKCSKLSSVRHIDATLPDFRANFRHQT